MPLQTNSRLQSDQYVRRRLRLVHENGTEEIVDEAFLLTTSRPKVILGEPGMGKTELILHLCLTLGIDHVTASRFMSSKQPSRFVVQGRPLVIDALDEAIARRNGEAVDAVLAQLEEAGTPDFILSCRSREWQSRTFSSLGRLYGVDPVLLYLQGFSQQEARELLSKRYPEVSPDRVFLHLDTHNLNELCASPLMLDMLGRVAAKDSSLPQTRALLLHRMCSLLWPEHDADRNEEGLAGTSEAEALSAAGALMATALLNGAEAISVATGYPVEQGDLRLAELCDLPGANSARAVFSSKLFQSVGVGRAQHLHKVIAEFLGARWLAVQANTPRKRRRLLAAFNYGGEVPSSLRGLHTWLAFHSPDLAQDVISTDPYGVLRYGDTAGLSAGQARCMLAALTALSRNDPYFRSRDWDSHTAASLMVENLQEEIKMAISSPASNEHLRSLLIEGMKGTPLADKLGDVLETILLSELRFYRERSDAALALIPHRTKDWWWGSIEQLRQQCNEESTRLAHEIAKELSFDVPDELLVAVLLAEMGASFCVYPRLRDDRSHTVRYYKPVAEQVSSSQICNILNLLAEQSPLIKEAHWTARADYCQLVEALVSRAIDEKFVDDQHGQVVWTWLGSLRYADHSNDRTTNELQDKLDTNHDLRHAVQYHALYVVRTQPSVWVAQAELNRRRVGLAGRVDDIQWFLEKLGTLDNKDPVLRQDWFDFLQLAGPSFQQSASLQSAAALFQRDDSQLKAQFLSFLKPKVPAWRRRQESNEAKRKRKQSIEREWRRRHYVAKRHDLLAGEMNAIVNPAQIYLGAVSSPYRDLPPKQRLIAWMGEDLAQDAICGFEAVLGRDDLPKPTEVSESFANQEIWKYCYPILAGLLEKHRSGEPLADASPDALAIGLLLCIRGFGFFDEKEREHLRDVIEHSLFSGSQTREEFIRLHGEPLLACGAEHIPGLRLFSRSVAWQDAFSSAASCWLISRPLRSIALEEELVDELLRSVGCQSLVDAAIQRSQSLFDSEERLLLWLSVDVALRFDEVSSDVWGIGSENPNFLWHLRRRLRAISEGRRRSPCPNLAAWIVSEFRSQWPDSPMRGGWGDENPFDASNFIRGLVGTLADDTSPAAEAHMQQLVAAPCDTYSPFIRHAAAEQRQKRAEERFKPLAPSDVAALLSDGQPSSAGDLMALVLEELSVSQKVLIGDDLDQVRDFWNDSGLPQDENRCRDRLAAMLGPVLRTYGIQRITEADMPKSKRADLAFGIGDLQLPMEIKGQWHEHVWNAASDQLDAQYLVDWRSEGRGIYCVLWFGELPAASRRRLKRPPRGLSMPQSAAEMRNSLIQLIPESRRGLIDVMVLDLSAGRR